jgi:xylulokinase
MKKESSAVLMGVDIGTSSSKGVLVLPTGEIVVRASVDHQVSIPKPGWFEHDADRIWLQNFCQISHELISGLEGSTVQILAVGISSICSAMLLLDENRKPLRPAILYGVDTRASTEVEEIKHDLGKFVTNQNIPPKIRWVQNNEPEIWNRIRHILSGHQYIVMKLTDRICQNLNDIHNFYPLIDDRLESWISDDFDYFHIDQRMLPEIVWSTEVVGRVTREGSAISGLPVGTPVIAGTNDAAAEALSSGAAEPGEMMLMYGSSQIFDLVSEKFIRSEKYLTRRLHIPGRYGLGGGLATAGSLTAWFREQLGQQEVSAEKSGGEDAYPALEKLASQSPAGANGLIMLPYFSGERAPIFDGNALGLYFGLNLTHTRADLYRALMESVGYGIRHCLEQFAEDDLKATEIYAIGGGVKNLTWMQIVSDICNLKQNIPVEKIGACYGDAFLAGFGIGLFEKISDVKQWVKLEKQIEPDLDMHEQYTEFYEIYKDLYPRNRGLMHRLSAIQKRGA